MGISMNTVFINANTIQNQYNLKIINLLIEKYNLDIYFDDSIDVDGYKILSIYDDNIDSLKLGIDITNTINALTISIFSLDSDFAIFQLSDIDVIIRIVLNKKLASSYGYNIKDYNIGLLTSYIKRNDSISDIKQMINNEYIFVEDGIYALLGLFEIDYNKILNYMEGF